MRKQSKPIPVASTDRELVQVNARVPQFLLPVLAEHGYSAEIDETRSDRVLVRIRRVR